MSLIMYRAFVKDHIDGGNPMSSKVCVGATYFMATATCSLKG